MKISIIVPIYNAEKYLENCINSIINQSYYNMQIVLVNDGSTDKSGSICEKYASNDDRILYIEKKNGGLVSARKAGVLNADGDYIGWVDADDWVEANYFESMVNAQNETAADIVCAAHFHDIAENSEKIVGTILAGTYDKKDLLPQMLYGGSFFEFGIQPHVWNKLFKREILMKTQLKVDDRIVYGEDTAVTYPSILKADKVCITDIAGYHYVQRQSTISKNKCLYEKERLTLLMEHLKQQFNIEGISEILMPQLYQYKKYVLLMRQPQILDERMGCNGQILMPYGGIEQNSKIVLYGAGVLGQRIYRYLEQYRTAQIVFWVDRNYKVYQAGCLDVHNPEELISFFQYDYILIANSLERSVQGIIKYMRKMKISQSKIRWLMPEFIDVNFRI